MRERIINLALDEPALSPRELAVRFTDTESYFVSEASVYRLLKAHDLIASPAFIVMKAADEFKDKTTAPNQLWQTDFTYLKVIGWGWFYLSTVLDDFSRYIIAWKLCTTMKAEDVTDTLDLALEASGCDQATVVHRPRLLSPTTAPATSRPTWPNGSMHRTWSMSAALPTTADPGQDRALASDAQEPHPARELLPARRSRSQIEAFVADYNHRAITRASSNLTPADVYFGRGQTILIERERIKRKTIANRRLLHRQQAA